jgi:hypothetical protein
MNIHSCKSVRRISFCASVLLLLAGCATPTNNVVRERGPDNTVAYNVPVDSSEAGARIQVNGEFVGSTPMTLKIWGDRDGTFHNFGSYDFIVRAYPPGKDRRSVTKVFHTGALMAQEDRIPEKIYFQFEP